MLILIRELTRRYIRHNVNLPWQADNRKSIRELGLSYRPLKDTLLDSFQSLIDAGVL